jgi:hypothetical protein
MLKNKLKTKRRFHKMKFNKKTKIIMSFALGTVMFTTTAIAGVVNKSGYDQLKDSVKYTAENCTTQLSSYTADMSLIMKDNSKVIFSENSINKVDTKNQATETQTTRVDGSTKTENYSYSDKNGSISKNNGQDVYFLNQYQTPRENPSSKNPFKEKEATDIEKIIDALVGNLKDAVVVTENSDGSKTLSGSLSESQIPALINAVVSLQSKSMFGNEYNNGRGVPKITNDVFVKEVKGNMLTTKEGLIQSVLGRGVVSGKDENGKVHNLSFELLAKISNVNSTKVSKPNLSGKKVEKNVEKDYSKLSNPEKYIGKYKSDVLIEKEGKFEKIGEKFVEVTTMDDKGISGRYYEEYAKGYEEYATNKKDFKFQGKFQNDNQFGASFSAEGSSNNTIKGDISIDQYTAKVNFNINESQTGNKLNDSQYSRVFN